MDLMNYIKPELIIVAIACYFVGMALKNTRLIKDKFIPLVLGGFSILACTIYVLATCPLSTSQNIMMAIFTAVTQGILAAGLSTYVHQLIKQAGKKE